MARVFMYGSYHTHDDFRCFYRGLMEAGHTVIRGYTYANESRYDSATKTRQPPLAPWPYSDSERAQLKALEASSAFRLDDFLDSWGAIREARPETERSLAIVLASVDVFFAVQTVSDIEYMAGSANQKELFLAGALHGRTGRPQLVHFGTCDPTTYVLGYLRHAICLPRHRPEAAGHLLRLLAAYERP
jgi:hypothetical protein